MPGKTRDEEGRRRGPKHAKVPPQYVVARREQPQGEEGIRWVHLSLARNLWLNMPPYRPAG